MTTADSHVAALGSSTWRDYLELGKPRVVSLIVFTAIVGMFLAAPGLPPLTALLFGTLGIGLAASSAAAINHVLDQRFDVKMARTRRKDVEFARFLVEEIGIAAVPGTSFYQSGGETKLRFTFSKKDETLHEACRRLERLVTEFPG